MLAAIKLIAAIVTNSLALYSEAGHSAMDGFAALVTFFAIKKASQPPDKEHPYGHDKFESMGALFELMLLVGLGLTIAYHALERLFIAQPKVEVGALALGIMGLSLCIETWRAFVLRRAAKKSGSEALAASAVHFLTDFLDSLVVITGLVMTALGYPKADAIAALFVAGVVFSLCFRLGKQVFSSLTDSAPEGVTDDIAKLVLSIPQVKGVHDIRIRSAGPHYFTEMHVEFDASLPLGAVHNVLDEIESQLHAKYPTMHIVTHPEPKEENHSAE